MRQYLLYFLLICNLIFLVSCKKDKFKAPKASFLVVNNVSLKTIISQQGVNSHKIVDIWYYVDGEFKGVFPVGSVMPIVAKDNAVITLFAGIKNNGISSTRLPYPVYNSISYNLDIEPGKTYTLSPQFEYNSTAFFYYADNFDLNPGQGSFFDFSNTNCQFTTDPTKVFDGTGRSVIMTMNDAVPSTSLIQHNSYYLPDGGAVIYVELDYKSNHRFNVGVIGIDVQQGIQDTRNVVTVNPSEEWSHIYIQLTKSVSTPPTYGTYKVYIEGVKAEESPEIYIDNVKLIYQ